MTTTARINCGACGHVESVAVERATFRITHCPQCGCPWRAALLGVEVVAGDPAQRLVPEEGAASLERVDDAESTRLRLIVRAAVDAATAAACSARWRGLLFADGAPGRHALHLIGPREAGRLVVKVGPDDTTSGIAAQVAHALRRAPTPSQPPALGSHWRCGRDVVRVITIDRGDVYYSGDGVSGKMPLTSWHTDWKPVRDADRDVKPQNLPPTSRYMTAAEVEET